MSPFTREVGQRVLRRERELANFPNLVEEVFPVADERCTAVRQPPAVARVLRRGGRRRRRTPRALGRECYGGR